MLTPYLMTAEITESLNDFYTGQRRFGYNLWHAGFIVMPNFAMSKIDPEQIHIPQGFNIHSFDDFEPQHSKTINFWPHLSKDKIIVAQEWVDTQRVTTLISKSLFKLNAVKFEGWYLFSDGHHRLTAALLAKKPVELNISY